jgi:hypothetical protein
MIPNAAVLKNNVVFPVSNVDGETIPLDSFAARSRLNSSLVAFNCSRNRSRISASSFNRTHAARNFSPSSSLTLRNSSTRRLATSDISRISLAPSLISAAHAAARLGRNANAHNPRNNARTSVPPHRVTSRNIAIAICIGSVTNALTCATTPSGTTNSASVIDAPNDFHRASVADAVVTVSPMPYRSKRTTIAFVFARHRAPRVDARVRV